MPLYPVYALLMVDAGTGPAQLSALLSLWSLVAFVVEVPSGALADRMPRRRLLAVGAALRAAGFALWTVAPSTPSFAAGFLLWGTGSALSSGTWEALVYDELTALSAADGYARLKGRSEVLSTAGVVVGTALAAPLVALGGYAAAGWASVATGVLAAAVALRLPERPRTMAASAGERGGPALPVPAAPPVPPAVRRGHPGDAEPSGDGGDRDRAAADDSDIGYLATLRAGVSEARSQRAVRRAVLVAALLPGLTAVDEYLGLLADAAGADGRTTPLLLLGPYVGLAVGAELAGRYPRVRPDTVAAVTALGAVTLAAGALVARPVGFAGLGICYAALWFGSVTADTRLQQTMSGDTRATVTSVSGLGAELVALVLFAGYGVGSRWAGPPVLVAAVAVPVLLVAVALPRWLPPARLPTKGMSAPT